MLLSAGMSRRFGLESSPNSYIAPGEKWPYGSLREGAAPEAYLAQWMSKTFRGALEARGWTQVKASEKLGMSTHTIHDLLEGKSWTSFAVIARIEQRLDIDLWSKIHKTQAGMQKRR